MTMPNGVYSPKKKYRNQPQTHQFRVVCHRHLLLLPTDPREPSFRKIHRTIEVEPTRRIW